MTQGQVTGRPTPGAPAGIAARFPRIPTWALMILIAAAGALLRFSYPQRPDLGSDTIEFWRICSQPVAASYVFSHWMELIGDSGQFPLALATAKAFLNATGLPLTQFTVRFPSACWGVAAIVVAFFAGRAFGGRRVGLTLALLIAVSPFHIQCTREAYFYPPLVLGVVFGLWGAAKAVALLQGERVRPLPYLAVNAAGFFLLTWSTPTGWSVAILVTAVVMICTLRVAVRQRHYGLLAGLVALYLALGCPLLVAAWGLPQIRNVGSAEHAAYVKRIFTSDHPSLGVFLSEAALAFGWGTTPIRQIFTWGALALGAGGLLVGLRRRPVYGLLPYLAVGVVAFFLYTTARTGAPWNTRYVFALFVVFHLTIAVGLWEWVEGGLPVIGRAGRGLRFVPPLVVAVGVLLWLRPAVWSAQLGGRPTQYSAIRSWTDSNLPAGSPVLVDRWFEPWNELALYHSTNVSFTFTVPNEPLDVYIRVDWRKTAREFFAKNLDASYLEISRSYWTEPQVGPWEWPREFFHRRVAFSNEPASGLMAVGQFYRGGTSYRATELFYNTREDVLEAARKAGTPTLFIYGKGWTYTKLWRQIPGDYRDWRVLTERATLDLYNLTSERRTVAMQVRAVAVGATTRVKASTGAETVLPMGQITGWKIPDVVLQPGLTTVELARLGRDAPNAAVLVEAVTLE